MEFIPGAEIRKSAKLSFQQADGAAFGALHMGCLGAARSVVFAQRVLQVHARQPWPLLTSLDVREEGVGLDG